MDKFATTENRGVGKKLPGVTDASLKNQTQGANINVKTQEIYVKKWVDYSSKYGLGYLLSNGYSGVFFNDCTKVI